jgi:hypothetical protein
MNRPRAVLALVIFGTFSAASVGQEAQPQAPAQDPQPAQAQPPAQTAPQQHAGRQAQSPQAAPQSGDDEFVPSEEISADEEVTFPVDI